MLFIERDQIKPYTFIEIILQVQATTYITIRRSNNEAFVKCTDKEKIQFPSTIFEISKK